MEMRVYVNDSAWAGALFPPQLALVMVGERSDIRVENLEGTPGKRPRGRKRHSEIHLWQD